MRTLPELLSETAVVLVSPRAVRLTLIVHERLHSRVHGVHIDVTPGEQLLDENALRRRIRVQREVHPGHVHVKVSFQLFNTPGTEITPGSDVVRENFQFDSLAHTRAPGCSCGRPTPIPPLRGHSRRRCDPAQGGRCRSVAMRSVISPLDGIRGVWAVGTRLSLELGVGA